MDLKLEGKVALVVASSQGLGKACATELFKEGANVMITSRNSDALVRTCNEIRPLGKGKIASFPCDVTRPDDIKELVQQTRIQLGTIDILVNNSGGPLIGKFDDLQDKDWETAFELIILNFVRMIREVLPDLKLNKGRIINLASSSIKQPIPGLVLSNVFRAGVLGLSKSLAEELAPYNVLVHTIAPGRIATDRVASIDQSKANKLGITLEEIEMQSKKMILLSRYGQPDEFGRVVAFFASEACSYMTGSAIIVDGGMIRAF